MLRFILPLALFCALSCSKEPPPTAPAGKKNCDFCDLFDTFRDQSDGDTASDSSSSSSSSDSSSSDGVFIPDAALRTALEQVLEKNPGETIKQEEMNTLEFFNGTRLGIKDLRGLETAENLTFLALDLNTISDLTPLQNLTNLERLQAANNAISDLTPLANLVNLRSIYIINNQISDLTPLQNLTSLRDLDFANNAVSDLTPIKNLELIILGFNFNAVSDLTPLSNIDRLVSLRFSGNDISDLTPLTNLSHLRQIDFDWNNVSDLSPLIALPRLEKLNAWGNPLSETSINEHIPALQSRDITISFSSFDPFAEGPFSIELVFLDDFTDREKEIWHQVAKLWEAAIQTELPDYEFPNAWSSPGSCGEHPIEIPAGEQIDDLRIYIEKFIDGEIAAYGSARLRRSSSFPIIGCIGIDARYDTRLDNIRDLGIHEIAHVLGFSTSSWRYNEKVRRSNGETYLAGPKAIAAFNQAGGTDYQGAKVPLDPDATHWHHSVLAGEVMSVYHYPRVLSAITLQALSDLGYSVDLSVAKPYVLPSSTAAKPVADEVPFCSLEGLPPPVYVDD